MIELHGVANSRAFRCLWMLEELGLPYRHVPTDYEAGAKQADFLRLNPNGRVPCLVDGELVLFESLAINLYLGRRYGGPLMPGDLADEGRVLQWTLWATNEVEPHLSQISRHRIRLSEQESDPRLIAAAEEALRAPLAVLDQQLSRAQCLLGSEFTLADLNLCAVLATALTVRYDLRPYPHVNAWFRRCLQRPAAQRVVAMVRAETK